MVQGSSASEYLFYNYQGGIGKGVISSIDINTNVITNEATVTSDRFANILVRPIYYNNKYYVFGTLSSPASSSFSASFGLSEIDPSTGNHTGNTIFISPWSDISEVTGSFNWGNIIVENNKVYGTSLRHLWEIDLDNNSFNPIHSFNSATDGSVTRSSTKSGDIIYSINDTGGANNKGTLYKYDLNTNTLTVLYNIPDGENYLSLQFYNNKLYTMKIDDATDQVELVSFDAVNSSNPTMIQTFDKSTYGYDPASFLTIESDIVYGHLNKGGDNGKGTIFSYDLNGSTLTKILSLNSQTGYQSRFGKLSYFSSPLSNDSESLETITIYPNPTTNIINITGVNIKEVRLFNVLGKEIDHSNTNQIDISKHTNGIYLLKIITDKGTTTKRIIKR